MNDPRQAGAGESGGPGRAAGLPGDDREPATSPASATRRRRQVVYITAGAIAIFVAMRRLPTGTNLSHMDFRVDARGANAIEFCDPLNPQFIPVVAARSPVTMALATEEPALAGRAVHGALELKTGSGKPIAAEDLLVTHTRKLHLLIVDPTLADYQHVHPEPGRTAGEWTFSFTPRRSGTYRVFGDFTPAATARGLYSSVDLNVAPGSSPIPDETGAEAKNGSNGSERAGCRFALTTAPQPARAGQPLDLRFSVTRADGGAVALEPVMGAFAHLVAFDAARSGFAHLHPVETDLAKTPDRKNPVLNFKLTIPRAGRYVVWAQVNLAGSETFVPFELTVNE